MLGKSMGCMCSGHPQRCSCVAICVTDLKHATHACCKLNVERRLHRRKPARTQRTYDSSVPLQAVLPVPPAPPDPAAAHKLARIRYQLSVGFHPTHASLAPHAPPAQSAIAPAPSLTSGQMASGQPPEGGHRGQVDGPPLAAGASTRGVRATRQRAEQALRAERDREAAPPEVPPGSAKRARADGGGEAAAAGAAEPSAASAPLASTSHPAKKQRRGRAGGKDAAPAAAAAAAPAVGDEEMVERAAGVVLERPQKRSRQAQRAQHADRAPDSQQGVQAAGGTAAGRGKRAREKGPAPAPVKAEKRSRREADQVHHFLLFILRP